MILSQGETPIILTPGLIEPGLSLRLDPCATNLKTIACLQNPLKSLNKMLPA